jgi:hypothetical protein
LLNKSDLFQNQIMGSVLLKQRREEIAVAHEQSVQEKVPKESTIDKIDKKKITGYDDIVQQLGNPSKLCYVNEAFFAHSYEEDCFLAGGGRTKFNKRYEWENNGKYLVAYMKDNEIIRVF